MTARAGDFSEAVSRLACTDSSQETLATVVGTEVAKTLERATLIKSYRQARGKCTKCAGSDVKLQKCARCCFTQYCGGECQKADWRNHKKVCKFLTTSEGEVNYCEVIGSVPFKADAAAPNVLSRGESHLFLPLTNEIGLSKSIEALYKAPVHPENTVAIGVGGFCLLDLASSRSHLTHILIVDISEKAQRFWADVIPIIQISESAAECEACLAKYFEKEYQDHIQPLHQKVQSGESWLSTPERFSRIQEIVKSNRLAFYRGNLSDLESCTNLAAIHRTHRLATDLFYLSNVINVGVAPVQFRDLARSLHSLTSPTTLIVKTQTFPFQMDRMFSSIAVDTGSPLVLAIGNAAVFSDPKNVIKLATSKGAIDPIFTKIPPCRPEDMEQVVSVRGASVGEIHPIFALAVTGCDPKELYWKLGNTLKA